MVATEPGGPHGTPLPLALQPILLLHRTRRRWGLVLLGFLIIMLGLWLAVQESQAARLRVLTCQRSEDQAVNCVVQLFWIGTTLRETEITALTAARLDELATGQARVLLDTAQGALPFTDPSADVAGQRAVVERVNAFLRQPGQQTLVENVGGAWQGFVLGALGGVLSASGFFLMVRQYRIVTRASHQDVVGSVAFSSDGQLLASTGADGLVHLWRVDQQRWLRTLTGPGKPLSSLAFTPNSQLLAAGGWDPQIQLWSVAEGTALPPLSGHNDQVVSVAISSDGQWLASASWDHTIRVWRLADGTLLQTLSGHSGPVEGVAFAADGEQLVSCSADCTVRVWRLEDGAEQQVLTHPEAVTCVAVSPDGQWLASGAIDHQIRLWQLASGRLSQTLSGHSDWVRSLAFSPDGALLLSASLDQSLRVWNAGDGSLLQTLPGHQGEVSCVAVSPDGQWAATGSGDQMVRLWRLREAE